ncbi:hypothetical protein H8B06_09555 [Sphingobacterium sp. DN00404]|uniref:Uncharacterized protein n=1 Tax=Sphingobacterium micropteri TaxID=2763501 RepID=A0ABR7YP60_9SPHI|nr:hypothetical protein [Sphingobacterium micropteri]MBD1433069.1 hypothetical protein [Sphingobacterium micropteri]
MSSELLIMFRDFAVSYKDNVVHARNIAEQSRAVIDHSKDIFVMSGNKFVLILFKTNDYRDLLTMSLYIVIKYMVGGAMYMYKIAPLKLSQKETAYGSYCRTLLLIKGKRYRENT